MSSQGHEAPEQISAVEYIQLGLGIYWHLLEKVEVLEKKARLEL
jgi:hypothetical protein